MNAQADLSWRARWNNTDRNLRIGLLGGFAAVAAAVAVFTWISIRPDFVPLEADLPKSETAAVVAKLEDLHVSYKVDEATGTVLVSSSSAVATRAQLADKLGPLKPSSGFELFDNGDFGMTEFTERINYQRALEGELARTIMALAAVRYARVHLVLPQSTIFKKANEPAKASILVIARRGESLTPEQISGIQSLVAAAVPELRIDGVAIHDDRGMILSTGSSISPAASGLEIRAELDVEDYLATKAEGILAGLFPPGSATVSVEATLVRGHVSSVRDELLPGASATAASATANGESRAGHISQQWETPPGGIQRISVGVVIPDPASRGMSLEQVRDLLAAAIGIDPGRGDRIAVYVAVPPASLALQPSRTLASPPQAATDRPQSPGGTEMHRAPKLWVPVLFACVGAAVLLVLALRPRRQLRRMNPQEREQLLDQLRLWLAEEKA